MVCKAYDIRQRKDLILLESSGCFLQASYFRQLNPAPIVIRRLCKILCVSVLSQHAAMRDKGKAKMIGLLSTATGVLQEGVPDSRKLSGASGQYNQTRDDRNVRCVLSSSSSNVGRAADEANELARKETE